MKATYILSGYLFMLVVYTTQAHDISKRATADELYILAERDGGCVSVQSIEPCPVTWKLSALAAKFYNQQARQIRVALAGMEKMSASDECKNAFKTTMCSQAAPKCSADGSQDYGDVATACAKFYSECPKNVSEHYKSQMLCDNVYSGKYAKPTCVTPPKIEGNCPQPKYKMPTDALYIYKRFSSDNETIGYLKQFGASSHCTSNVQKVQCVAVYCSEDEKYLLTEYTKADCESTTKPCLIDPIEAIIKADPAFLEMQFRPTIENLEEKCAVYPNSSNTQYAPPTAGTLPPGATVKIPKVVYPNSSNTQAPPPTGTLPPGSTVKITKVGPTSSGNIQAVDCVALLFSFIVVKLFA